MYGTKRGVLDREPLREKIQNKEVLLAVGAVTLGAVGGLAAVAFPNPLVGFGLVAGLVVGFFMLGRPLFTLMVATIISLVLPFAVIPVKLGLTFTLLEASLLVLFAVWIIRLGLRSNEDEQKLITTPFDWSIWLLVGVCLFAFILSLQWVNQPDIYHNFFKFLLAILSFFAVINIVRTQAALDLMLKVIVLAGSLAGFIGVGLYVLPRTLQERILLAMQAIGYPTSRVLRYVEDDPGKGQRATGFSIDPNSYGGLLVLAISVIFCQIVSPKPIFKRWQLIFLILGPAAALFFTYGRGAQLGAVLVVAFVATVKYRKIWLYIIPAAPVAWLILPSNFKQRFLDGFALQDQATVMRLDEYRNALDIIQRYPLFGVGFGTAPSVDLTTGASMIYLTIAERTGLLGLFCYLLMAVLFFAYCLRIIGRIQDPRHVSIVLGFAGGIVGALVTGVLDHYFFNIEYSHMAALFWLFMALAVAQIKIAERSQESGDRTQESGVRSQNVGISTRSR